MENFISPKILNPLTSERKWPEQINGRHQSIFMEAAQLSNFSLTLLNGKILAKIVQF